MADLHEVLQTYVGDGSLPGAVGLVARGDRAEVAVAGSIAVGGAAMARDSIFRLASITKPLTAAAVMMLVEDGRIALDDPGQGWGFGGSVDVAAIEPWNVPGRYGWVGGTGTSAHITPSTGTVAILLTQVAADFPVPPEWMRDFWRYAGGLADARE